MTAKSIIEEIKKLPPEELDKVADYFEEIEATHEREAHRRSQEMEKGTIASISEEEGRRRLKTMHS